MSIPDVDLAALCLNPQDLARVAEFFDSDVDAAFHFARKVWLPDAWETAQRIMTAAAGEDLKSVFYLCDSCERVPAASARCESCVTPTRSKVQPNSRSSSTILLNVIDLERALDALAGLLSDCSGMSLAAC